MQATLWPGSSSRKAGGAARHSSVAKLQRGAKRQPADGAISLGTTVLFLSLIQLSKAVGVTGIVNPVAAAWAPNVLFLGAAIWLMRRVRT
jgi:lipopolysaccharide export LptBFGC system permease protein LptF